MRFTIDILSEVIANMKYIGTQRPFFFHGTPLETNVELQQEKNAANKTPMIWLLEEFVETRSTFAKDNTDFELQCRLFFLTQGNPEEWLTEDAWNNAVKPMMQNAEFFIEQLQIMSSIFNTSNLVYKITPKTKFGVYITNAGAMKSLFADKLSGCELSISSLKIYQVDDCAPPCNYYIPNYGVPFEIPINFNVKIAQTGGGAQYSILAGAVNDTNDIFTVPEGRYNRIIAVAWQGQIRFAGESWSEINPMAGQVKLNPPPFTGDRIIIWYE